MFHVKTYINKLKMRETAIFNDKILEIFEPISMH